jgi:MFS transporter, DHA1 family, tetracycline resistance protein
VSKKIEFPKLIPLWIAVFIDILGFTILIPFLPFFMDEFGVSALVIGLLLSTNAVFGLFCGPILSNLSDKYGRKPLLLISQAGTLVGFVMLAFSNSITMLFLSRIVDGLFGGNFPIAKAAIGDVVPPKKRSKEMANIGVAYILSGLFGPWLGGFLSRWGLIAPGLVSAGLSGMTMILTAFVFKETLLPENRTKSKNSPKTHNLTIGNQTHEAGKPVDVFNLKEERIWSNKLARKLLIIWGFHTLSFIIYVSTITIFAKIVLEATPEEMGNTLAISGLFRLFIRFVVFVPLIAKLGDNKTMKLGLACFVIAFFGFVLIDSLLFLGLILLVISFAASCSRGPITGFLSRAVGPKQQGKIMGISTSLDNFGQVLGPIIGGILLDQFDPIWFGVVIGILALISFMMALNLPDMKDKKYPKTPTIPITETNVNVE